MVLGAGHAHWTQGIWRQWQAAAEMLDLAQALFDSTLDYLKQHVRFNQMLAS